MFWVLRNVAIAAWALFGAAVVGILGFQTGLLIMFHPAPWNFPGDPPLFDVLILAAGFSAAINVPIWLIARRWWAGPWRLLGSLSRMSAIASLALFVVAAAGIVERHSGRWSAVRAGIRQYGDRVAAAAGDRNRVLSYEEFVEFQRKVLPTPIPVHLPGYGTVSLRMAHGVYPYVGVDFPGGGHALFDPRTMMCTYSD